VPLAGCSSRLPVDDESSEALTAFGVTEGSADACGILRVANEYSLKSLDDTVKLDSRAATGIIMSRAGVDGVLATADDAPFKTLEQLDLIGYVGSDALTKLLNESRTHGFPTSTQCAPPAPAVPTDYCLLKWSKVPNQSYSTANCECLGIGVISGSCSNWSGISKETQAACLRSLETACVDRRTLAGITASRSALDGGYSGSATCTHTDRYTRADGTKTSSSWTSAVRLGVTVVGGVIHDSTRWDRGQAEYKITASTSTSLSLTVSSSRYVASNHRVDESCHGTLSRTP
jgi:hypothetical protein